MSLAAWIEREAATAARLMLRSISPIDIVKRRPGFGQVIVPKPGSIVASPELASYDPDPDYFFHWVRDSAIVIDALRLSAPGAEGARHFRDFLRFSLDLAGLRGAALGDVRHGVQPAFLQYLRDEADLATLEGERLLGEPRFNADGTLDIVSWSRPQTDGPALRALAVLRWSTLEAVRDAQTQASVAALLRLDLDFTAASWRAPSIDIWEEDLGHHYYTRLVQQAALGLGARWASGQGDAARTVRWAAEAAAIEATLDDFRAADGGIVGRLGVVDGRPDKDPDIATILAVLHAERAGAAHGLRDPAIAATLARLEAWCADAYPINRDRPAGSAPALGRYPGDVYYGGNAFVPGTLAAAELSYRRAAAGEPAELARGDAHLAALRRFVPASGALPEQLDRTTGAPVSAKNLAWSHAAFVTAAHWRRRAVSAGT
jgi:glucoamylase